MVPILRPGWRNIESAGNLKFAHCTVLLSLVQTKCKILSVEMKTPPTSAWIFDVLDPQTMHGVEAFSQFFNWLKAANSLIGF